MNCRTADVRRSKLGAMRPPLIGNAHGRGDGKSGRPKKIFVAVSPSGMASCRRVDARSAGDGIPHQGSRAAARASCSVCEASPSTTNVALSAICVAVARAVSPALTLVHLVLDGARHVSRPLSEIAVASFLAERGLLVVVAHSR